MYIETVQLSNFRNYQDLELHLDQGTNIFTEITPVVRLIFWNLYICAEQRSPTEEVKTEKS